MKKWKKILFSLIFLLVGVVAITLCGGDRVEAEVVSDTHSVVFDYNMGALSHNLYSDIRSIGNYNVDVAHGEVAQHSLSSSDRERLSIILGAYTMEWFVGENKVTPNSYPVYEDTTFVAIYTPRVFTISFQFNDNTTYPVKDKIEPIKYTVEMEQDINFTYRNIPKRDHYFFVSWCSSPLLRDSDIYLYTPAGTIGSFTLYARWSPVEYLINYNTDGDNSRNPASYNVEDGDINLYPASKVGHIFGGWYRDKECTEKIDKITSGTTGAINIYPKWELEKYKVTYILPDGTREAVVCEYGKRASLPPSLHHSIFEVVKTDVSRDNITGNTRITISLINIWYVYVIALLVIVAIVVAIIVAIKSRRRNIRTLRTTYQSNSSKYNRSSRNRKY